MVKDCVLHSQELYGDWNVIVNPIELICCELLYMIVYECVCILDEIMCALCASRRECMMHNLVEIQ